MNVPGLEEEGEDKFMVVTSTSNHIPEKDDRIMDKFNIHSDGFFARRLHFVAMRTGPFGLTLSSRKRPTARLVQAWPFI